MFGLLNKILNFGGLLDLFSENKISSLPKIPLGPLDINAGNYCLPNEYECTAPPPYSTEIRLKQDELVTLQKALIYKCKAGNHGQICTIEHGYMPAITETKTKRKLERCKSCGQNEADYTYSNGVYKCNYCGSLSN